MSAQLPPARRPQRPVTVLRLRTWFELLEHALACLAEHAERRRVRGGEKGRQEERP